MKKITCAILLLATFSMPFGARAQQAAMYSQYMFNALAVNPAYAGSRNVLSATALYRTQWVGVPGSPKTMTFTMDAPVYNKKIGLGVQVFQDELGITKTAGGVLSAAYRIRMDKATLSFGMQGSVNQYTASYSTVQLTPSGGATDDPAFRDDVNRMLFNAGAGLYYNSDQFYVGLSAPELLQNKLTEQSTSTGATPRQSLHLFLAAGYVFPVNDDFKLKPSVLFKGVEGSPIEADLNATLWLHDRFAVGAQYRTSADVSIMFEAQVIPQVRIGYSYDHSLTRLGNYGSSSHEIMLRYEFGYQPGKVLSPRYF